jgi:hypothetical protein
VAKKGEDHLADNEPFVMDEIANVPRWSNAPV